MKTRGRVVLVFRKVVLGFDDGGVVPNLLNKDEIDL